MRHIPQSVQETIPYRKFAACTVVASLAVGSAVAGYRAVNGVVDGVRDAIPELPGLPDSFNNPPATIEIDDTQAVFEGISSRVVYEKTEHIEGIELDYDNKDQGWLPSSIAGASLDTTLSGNVTAMVNLTNLVESGVQPTADGQGLIITLSPAEHFNTSVDEAQTDFKLDHGWINDALAAQETEEQVRALAKETLTNTALQNGLLESTEAEAAGAVQELAAALLAGRGIVISPEDVEIEFTDRLTFGIAEQPGHFSEEPAPQTRGLR